MNLFYINTNEIQDKFLDTINKKYISQKEKQLLEKYIREKDKKNKLCSIFLQKYMYHNKFQIPIENIKFQYNTYGKPAILKGRDNYNYNISHDHNIVVGISDISPIGIDIIYIDRKKNFKYLKNCFAKSEWKHINQSTNKDKTFSIYWSLKEAYLKCIGTGIGKKKLMDYHFDIQNIKKIMLYINGKIIQNIYFKILEKDGYIIAIALKKYKYFEIKLLSLQKI